MHTTLTTMSLIFLIGAAVLSYLNKDKLADAKVDVEETKKDLEDVIGDLDGSRDKLKGLEGDIVSTNKALKTFTEQSDTLTSQIQEKEDALETLETDLVTAKESLSGMKDELREAGDIGQAMENLSNLRVSNRSLENKLASLKGEVGSKTKISESLQKEIDAITELNKLQDEGKVPANFSASISQVYPDWGFVVLGAGNKQRAAEGALLSVRRGGSEIAKLKVTDLLQNRAVADVVRGSLAPGAKLRAGDRAYPASN